MLELRPIQGIYNILHIHNLKQTGYPEVESSHVQYYQSIPIQVGSLTENNFFSIEHLKYLGKTNNVILHTHTSGQAQITTHRLFCCTTEEDQRAFLDSLDMCSATNETERLLIIAYKWVKAYNIGKQKCSWTISGHLPLMKLPLYAWSVCTDDAGHVFVVDANNNNVHKLTTHGAYVSTVLKKGDLGIGKPLKVSWLKDDKTLVLLHETTENECKIIRASGIKLL